MFHAVVICFYVFLRLSYCDNLVSIVVIYRHGARTPIDPYPTDPYRNQSVWPVDFGQLTNTGKLQQYELGQWYRQHYSTFLPSKYNETDLYVRSTDVDRTLMSAEAHLAGLYPPTGNQIWDQNLLWQPIPIHTLPELLDPFLAMKKPCPKYQKLYKNLLNTDYFRNITEQNSDLFEYLTNKSGAVVDSFQQLEYIYNTLMIETLYNFTLPEWTKAVFPDRLKPLAEFSFAIPCYTSDLARLKTGLLFNEIVTHLKNITTGKSNRKLTIYSAHDTTIANVLNSMGAFEYHCPPYTSTIMFELRRNETGGYYLNIFYKNTSDTLQKIVLGNCTFNCTFSEFVDILLPITLTLDQWEDECQLGWINMGEFKSVGFIVFGSTFICSLLIAAIVFIVAVTYFRRDNSYTQLPNDEVA